MTETKIVTFSGNQNLYAIIGRTSDGSQLLGCNLQVQSHPQTLFPYLIARFATIRTDGGQPATFGLYIRDIGTFLYGDKEVEGFRLNRFAIPLFNTPMSKAQVLMYGDAKNIWPGITDWLMKSVIQIGMEPLAEVLAGFARRVVELPPIDPGVETLIKFPDLKQGEAGENETPEV